MAVGEAEAPPIRRDVLRGLSRRSPLGGLLQCSQSRGTYRGLGCDRTSGLLHTATAVRGSVQRLFLHGRCKQRLTAWPLCEAVCGTHYCHSGEWWRIFLQNIFWVVARSVDQVINRARTRAGLQAPPPCGSRHPNARARAFIIPSVRERMATARQLSINHHDRIDVRLCAL